MVTPMSVLVTIIITHSMTGKKKSWDWVLKSTTAYTELVKSDILISYFSKILYKIVQKQM
jgi:hypothetical protein